MKKFIKSISLSVLALALVFTTSSVYATKDNNLSELDKKLIEMGYPEYLVKEWLVPIKVDLVENATGYLGSVTYYYDEETGQFYEQGDVRAQGTIPDSDMRFTVTASSTVGSNGRSRILASVDFNWDKIPFWRLTDPFGIAWDENIFRPVDSTTYYAVTHHEAKSNDFVVDSGNEIAYSAANGIGWNADLLSDPGQGFYYDDIYGYGRVVLETKSTSRPSGSSQLHANYAHVKSPGTFGLTFKGINVSFSGFASHDTRGAYRTFNYSYVEF